MHSATLAFLILFFASGATGLVYEVLWTRQLALIFGVTTYAVSTVLATYMGGLALGSYLLGRYIDRVRNPLLFYAGLEVAIGLYALLVPYLFDWLRPAYIGLAQQGLSYSAFSFARSMLAASVLLLPTTMMGGTFPVLIRHWADLGGGVRSGTGLLYFVNTAGAIAGCSLAGFVLIERFGLAGTNWLAAAANVTLGLLAAALARSAVGRRAAGGASAASVDATSLPHAMPRLLLVCAGLSGFISLAAQVLWSRALLRYLYNSTYAFTAMLTTFLVGIALGSVLYTAFLSRRSRPLLVLVLLQTAAAVGFLASGLVFPQMASLPAWLFGTDIVGSFQTSVLIMLLRAACVLLPPVLFLGAIFPLTIALYASGRGQLGKSIGSAYAANTLGAILGSLGCAFVLIPLLGMWDTHRLLIAMSFLIAGSVAFVAVPRLWARAAVGLGLVAALAASLVLTREDVFRSTFLQNPGARLEYYEEGPTDTVAVASSYGQRTIVYEDQRGTASTSSYAVNLFLGHLPMLLHPGQPEKVLHICFGVGNSLSAVAAHPELERVDNVELSPHTVGAGPLFWSNDAVLDHPKVRTIIDDGRNYLMTTNEIYDVIMLEPPETFTAGVINLYTKEFYEDAISHLADDGVMMQWIPTANGTVEEEKEMFRAFGDVFPHSTLWWLLDSGCALLIGTKKELRIDYTRLRSRMEEPRVRQDMALSQVRDVDHFLSYFVFGEKGFAEFTRGARPTTDDHTVLDFSMPRYVGSGFGLGQFSRKAVADSSNPFLEATRRRDSYFEKRESVLPYLSNLGGESPQAIASRIEERRAIRFKPRFFQEEEWKRMRADGSLPEPPAAPDRVAPP